MSTHIPSQEQLALAKLLGVNIQAESFDIAAARLLDAVAPAIGFEPAEASSARQKAFAHSLGCDVAADTKRVASAKIGEALFARNQQAIASLDLKQGDQVVRVMHFEYDGEMRTLEQEFVISSIQPS